MSTHAFFEALSYVMCPNYVEQRNLSGSHAVAAAAAAAKFDVDNDSA